MIIYGPVPSRRLGRSLGINNIPHKTCSYSCVYCQLGRTKHFQVEPTPFYEPSMIVEEARKKTARLKEMGEGVDYLTFVPDGEPTLDVNLAPIIQGLKPLGIKIAVITNGSLLGRRDVREALGQTDWVSFKVDAVTDPCWDRINRPHGSLRLQGILEGMLEFKSSYRGIVATETMLVRDLNDGDGNLNAVASFLRRLEPAVAYLSIPTRPPAESWVLPPSEEQVARAHTILTGEVGRVEHLIGYEGNAFSATGRPEDDLLAITAVHPMRAEAVSELLEKTGGDWSVVQGMIDRGLLVEAAYEGRRYFLRKFPELRRRL
ncbi:MAG: radical SAM protein [Spirochaetales bacterium]|nr:radical SAM protein [Spirochaetales bacterium]